MRWDALLAVTVAGVVVTSATGPVDLALLLAGTLVLAVRRRAPRVVLFVCLGFLLAAGVKGLVVAVPVLVALYTVVAAGHRVVGIVVAAPLVAGAVGMAFRQGAPAEEALLPAGWFVAALLLGEVARQREAHVRAAEERAAAAERTREETALRRAAEERLRIARDLHDSLTHSISVIKVQAGVAVHLARKRGEAVPEVLLAIQEASGEAARELRATLGALRTDGLDRLPGLLDRTRRTGVDVSVTTTGRPHPLPADVDRAAYRIIQEALTNVTRHADTATATVTLDYGPDQLTVRIDDDGVVSREVTPGLGLLGMGERVAELGGRLRAEPRERGGFSVCADFPLPGDHS